MGFWTFYALAVVVVVVILIVASVAENEKLSAMSPSEKKKYLEDQEAKIQAIVLTQQHGQINPALVCPHCQGKGSV